MITITVTQDDIEKGEATNCHYCPIAIAAKRAFKAYSVSCAVRLLIYTDETSYKKYKLPDEALNFIGDFDNGKGVEPFEFEIDETKPLI